jgi:signal transduction histidine kinase
VAMRRVEGFNAELKHEVDTATTQLTDTLVREHALALANTRIGERLNLVRDLHDGFGGSLLGAIAALEQSPPSTPATHAVATLKELRDDLRLVIDSTTREQDSDLAGLLAPLRHRWSQRFEALGIDSRWQLEDIEGLHLGPIRSLDLLRLLQEALTNVLKHSGAAHVEILVCHDGQCLHVEVRDDGCGFDATAASSGTGLTSLRGRASRLGGELALRTAPGHGATLALETPLPPV